MGKSITTWNWQDHLYDYWKKHGGGEKVKVLDSIDWDASVQGNYDWVDFLTYLIGMVLRRRFELTGASRSILRQIVGGAGICVGQAVGPGSE
jgi:hypothetical protein